MGSIKNNIAIFALMTAVLAGCSSQQYDEPDYAVLNADPDYVVPNDEAAVTPGRVSRVDLSALKDIAGLIDCSEKAMAYKDEHGLWYPINPNTRITNEEMREKIMGYGWIENRCWVGLIHPDGTYNLSYPDGNLPTGKPYASRFAFYPGFVRRYDFRHWGHDFFYHDDSAIDTDAPVIGYSSTDDRDWLMPVKLLDDNRLVVIRTFYRYCGNGVYETTGYAAVDVLMRVSPEEVEVWEERHSADYWGN